MHLLSTTGCTLRQLSTWRSLATIGLLAMMGAGFGASSAKAQGIDLCTACLASDGCDSAQQTCVAECRAQFFEIDPRRSQCIDRCSATGSQCTRQAKNTCRSQNACR